MSSIRIGVKDNGELNTINYRNWWHWTFLDDRLSSLQLFGISPTRSSSFSFFHRSYTNCWSSLTLSLFWASNNIVNRNQGYLFVNRGRLGLFARFQGVRVSAITTRSWPTWYSHLAQEMESRKVNPKVMQKVMWMEHPKARRKAECSELPKQSVWDAVKCTTENPLSRRKLIAVEIVLAKIQTRRHQYPVDSRSVHVMRT